MKTEATGVMINIYLSCLPEGTKEGSVIKYADGKYTLDREEQKSIEDRIADKMNSLWE